MASEEERRSKLLNDYCELRRTHPELPAQLRDFQVKANVAENCTFENQQVDILCSALDETNSSHIMVALPTGYGKSLPMLLLGLLMPKGMFGISLLKKQHINVECVLALNFGAICALQSNLPISQIGSTVFIVSPLTTIEDQLLQDCERMGIPAVAGSKACFFTDFLSFSHKQARDH